MRVLDLIRKRPVTAACSAGALLGVVVGMFLPIRAPEPPKPDKTAWSLPTANALKRFSNEQYQAVRNAQFWGELQMPGQRGVAKPASWTMTAIATRPQVQVAVGVPGKPQQVGWVRVGGVLPDGAILIAANRDTVWYEKDGCRRARKLYEKPTAESEACIGAKQDTSTVTPPGRPVSAAPPPAASPARKPH